MLAVVARENKEDDWFTRSKWHEEETSEMIQG